MGKWYTRNRAGLNLALSVVVIALCAHKWYIGKPAQWIDFAFISAWLILSEMREWLRGKE